MTGVSSWWLRGCFLTHCLYPLDAPARVPRAVRQGVLNRNGPRLCRSVAIAGDVAGGRSAREKPLGAERQRRCGGLPHAASLIRFRGGSWRVVLTPEHWARLVLALPEQPVAIGAEIKQSVR